MKIQEEVNGPNYGFLLPFIVTIGIGSVNYGYSIGVFNSLMVDFFHVFEIPISNQDFWKGLITSICSVGAAIGSLTAGNFAKFGKKKCIHAVNIILIFGCGLTTVKLKEVVVIGRFFFGVSAGAFSVFVPSFISELAPIENKGSLGSITQIMLTLGIFISNVLGIPLPDDKFNPYTPGFICD